MKATTDAPAVAHTALGCRRMLPAPASKGSIAFSNPELRQVADAQSMLAKLINASYIYIRSVPVPPGRVIVLDVAQKG
jgi:hypothetical protein